jgi:hypothetical protein
MKEEQGNFVRGGNIAKKGKRPAGKGRSGYREYRLRSFRGEGGRMAAYSLKILFAVLRHFILYLVHNEGV